MAPVTGTIPKPPNPSPTVVLPMSCHFRPHPMGKTKMEDVVRPLGFPLAQTTWMQMLNVRNRDRKQTEHPNVKQRCHHS